MSEFALPTKVCPNCNVEKIACMHFTPKARHCQDCVRDFYNKCKKPIAKDRKMGWKPLVLSRKRPFAWESI